MVKKLKKEDMHVLSCEPLGPLTVNTQPGVQDQHGVLAGEDGMRGKGETGAVGTGEQRPGARLPNPELDCRDTQCFETVR